MTRSPTVKGVVEATPLPPPVELMVYTPAEDEVMVMFVPCWKSTVEEVINAPPFNLKVTKPPVPHAAPASVSVEVPDHLAQLLFTPFPPPRAKVPPPSGKMKTSSVVNKLVSNAAVPPNVELEKISTLFP